MLTSVHVADIGPKAPFWRPPKPKSVAGLVRADGGMTARLSSSTVPQFDLGRIAMVARWQSESSLEAYLTTNGSDLRDGFVARCEPIRATGAWPGVEESLPSGREAEKDEPIIVVTQSLINWSRLVPLMKFNAEASGTMMMSDSLRWGSTFVGTPWFGSVTIWRSAAAMVEAVYNTRSGFGNATAPLEGEMTPPEHGEAHYGEGGHRGAMTAHDDSSFFRKSTYVRLRPLSIRGRVTGKNPLDRLIFNDEHQPDSPGV